MHMPTGKILPFSYIFGALDRTIISPWFEKHLRSFWSSKTTAPSVSRS